MSGQENNQGKKEGRYQFLLANAGPQIFEHLQQDQHGRTFGDDVESAFATFAKLDPTHNAKGKKYGYLQWLCTQYLNSFEEGNTPIASEELETIGENLKFFIDLKKRRRHEDFEKDLNRHTLETLADLKELYTNEKAKSRNALLRDLKEEIRDETTIYYEGPEGIIISPTTLRASQHWGQSSTWCVSARSGEQYNNYTKIDPLVMYLPQSDTHHRQYSKYVGHSASSLCHAGNANVGGPPANLRNLVNAAIEENPDLADILVMKGKFPYAHVDQTKLTNEAWLYLVGKDNKNEVLSSIPEALWADEQFACAIIDKAGTNAFYYIPEEHRTEIVTMQFSISSGAASLYSALRSTSEEQWQDEAFVEGVVALNPVAFSLVPLEHRTKNVCRVAINSFGPNPQTIKGIPAAHLEDEGFVLEIIESLPEAILLLDIESANRTHNMVLAAVEGLEGKALRLLIEDISNEDWSDEAFCAQLFSKNLNVFSCIADEHKTEAIIKLAAENICAVSERDVRDEHFKQLFQHTPAALWQNDTFLKDMLMCDLHALSLMKKPSKELCLRALTVLSEETAENDEGRLQKLTAMYVLSDIPAHYWKDQDFCEKACALHESAHKFMSNAKEARGFLSIIFGKGKRETTAAENQNRNGNNNNTGPRP